MRRQKQRDDGFTLLEMLVALAVIAVMGALMVSFLGQLGAINRREAEIATQTELDAAAAYLKRVLEGARPVRMLGAKPDTNPLFDGEAGEIRFGAVTRSGLYSLALRDVHIFVTRSDGRLGLAHTMAPRRLIGGRPVAHGLPIPILDTVDQVSFEYGGGGGWEENWSKDGELPKFVRITLGRSIGNRELQAISIARLF
jgi:prepilin-type N-terminal cleavage/methylation domain-containing protein